MRLLIVSFIATLLFSCVKSPRRHGPIKDSLYYSEDRFYKSTNLLDWTQVSLAGSVTRPVSGNVRMDASRIGSLSKMIL